MYRVAVARVPDDESSRSLLARYVVDAAGIVLSFSSDSLGSPALILTPIVRSDDALSSLAKWHSSLPSPFPVLSLVATHFDLAGSEREVTESRVRSWAQQRSLSCHLLT